MKILFTLDYELFLGEKTGSMQKCLMEPMQAYAESIEKYGARFTLFVDATYLLKLRDYSSQYPLLEKEYRSIVKHLQELQHKGHEIQLHIHPHWFYSTYNGTEWILDHDHYKLSDLTLKEAEHIFTVSKELLDRIAGKPSIAFRAGGFSAQPTKMLAHLFQTAGIKIDTSVCPGMWYNSSQQKYDYRKCPNESSWDFCNDICQEEKNGRLLEIPIATHLLSPVFYWKLILKRFIKSSEHQLMGDGKAINTTVESIWERVTKKTLGIATIDGFKISYLKDAYFVYKKKQKKIFCILGHPKLATAYSIKKLEEFCRYATEQGDQFVTISQCYEKEN